MKLSDRTVKGHIWQIRRFLESLGGEVREVSRADIREYLKGFLDMSSSTYANVLKSLRVFFRDFLGREELVKSFRFPNRSERVIIVPSREEIQKFYGGLSTVRDRAMFLIYATTGLRKAEVLSLQIRDIDFQKRMVLPKKRGKTKNSWVSFFNDEAEGELNEYLKSRRDSSPELFKIHDVTLRRNWKKAYEKTGIHITPQMLREWFSSEMGKLGVPDRYVDAFQGRIPKSVLARHYTDYSPEKLKEIYDKAGLKILS